MTKACSKRIIGDLKLFKSDDINEWEAEYEKILNPKYKKNIRNFSKKITGTPISEIESFKYKNPQIYLISRERGGDSYKNCNPVGCEAEDLFYAPISKGYSMNDVSSFSLGPVVGEGLCVVNAAFSKSICVMHLEGGNLDLKRKNFWKPKKERTIELIDNSKNIDYNQYFKVDGKKFKIKKWLKDNKDLWYPEWKLWCRSIALCSDGDFHWTKLPNGEYSQTLCYYNHGDYLDFVTWKKECYIKPAYELIKQTSVFEFLSKIRNEHKINIGLVHPMAKSDEDKPIKKSYLLSLFNDKNEMSCMPFVVAAMLLNITYEEIEENEDDE